MRPLFAIALLALAAAACGSDGISSVSPTLTIEKRGEGTVTSTPGGLDCGATCSAKFANGASVVLEAVAAPGGRLVRWGGPCSGSTATCTVALGEDKTVVADFAVPLEVVVNGTGRVVADLGTLSCPGKCSDWFAPGSRVTLTPTAGEGQEFKGFSGACTGTGACVVTLEAAASVTATFAPKGSGGATKRTLTLAVTGNGVVSADPAGVMCPGGCTGSYDDGTNLTLTAVSSRGHVFRSWGGACSGTAIACSLTMSADRSVTAAFEPATQPGSDCNWSRHIGTVGPPGRETVSAISVDPQGRTLVIANGSSDLAFGGTTIPVTSQYGNLVAVVLDRSGNVTSSFAKGHQGNASATLGVMLTAQGAWLPDGRIAVLGQWSGNMDFGDGVYRNDAPRYGNWRTFVAVYDTAGKLSWVKPLAETSSIPFGSNFANLAIDPTAGHITVGSHYVNPGETFGGSAAYTPWPDNNVAGSKGHDAFVAQYTSAGALRWVKVAGGPVSDSIHSVAMGAGGSVLFAGDFSGSANFGNGAFAANTPPSAIFGRYSATGTHQASRAVSPNPGAASAQAVAALPNGDAVVGGELSGTADFGGPSVSVAGQAAFVVRYTPGGQASWVTTFAGQAVSTRHVAYDATRSAVWAYGTFSGTTTFGSTVATSQGGNDLFLVRLDATTGAVQSVRTFGGADTEWALALTVDATGRVLLGGEYNSSIDLGLGAGAYAPSGFSDAFVACVSP